jgi:hypothetical protein
MCLHIIIIIISIIIIIIIIIHSISALERALIFLKCMVDEHVFMNSLSLDKNFSPRWFWDLKK